jgi:cohesin complex subunit SA-1/2
MNILVQVCNSVAYFMEATSLSNTNSSKILELEDQLSRALRDAVEGREELEISEFTADETLSLTALSARLRILAGLRDMSAWTDENEGGLQSSIWQILEALAERGRLGYKEDEEVSMQLDFV